MPSRLLSRGRFLRAPPSAVLKAAAVPVEERKAAVWIHTWVGASVPSFENNIYNICIACCINAAAPADIILSEGAVRNPNFLCTHILTLGKQLHFFTLYAFCLQIYEEATRVSAIPIYQP
jgi:hypothetical protein